MKEYISNSLEETAKIAEEIITGVFNKQKILDDKFTQPSKATVLGLSGHLGAGKTAFVKIVAKYLGIDEEITSPTFVIMKLYDIKDPKKTKFKKLIHIDAYRLESKEQLNVLNFSSLLKNEENLIMFEWPENVDLINQVEDLKLLKFESLNNQYKIKTDY